MARKNIDPAQVRALASIGCTMAEVGTVLGCSGEWIRRRFRQEFQTGQDSMKMSLRRWQYEKAKDGNVAMLIWLGKQYLGQSDRQDTTVTQQVVEIERIPAPRLATVA